MRSLTPRQTLIILTGLNLLNYIDRQVLSAVLPGISAEFQLTDGEAGRLNTMFMLGYFLSAPLFGWLGDRASRKWLIAAGIFIWSLGTVLTGFASTLLIMMVFRAMVGVGEASYATISPGLLSDVYPKEKRNNALTIFYVAIPIGAAMGSILGGWIEGMQGWRQAFHWVGAPGLILAAVLLPFREPARGAMEDRATASHHVPSLKEFLRLFTLRDYNLSVWGYTAYTFALGGFALWGPTFLQRVHQIEKIQSTTLFGAILVIAGLAGTLSGGFAATAWQKKNPAAYSLTLAISMLFAAPLAALAFFLPDRNPAVICLAAAMFFAFLGTGPINTLILESVPSNLRASAMAGSIFLIHLFGDMWSPEIVGHVSDATKSLTKGLLLLPAALAVSGILWGVLGWLQHKERTAQVVP